MGLYANSINSRDFQFFDLGSGGGRLVIQSYLELPSVIRSVGIELSSIRHQIATNRLGELKSNGELERIRQFACTSQGIRNEFETTIDLYEGDLFQLDISKATHIYLSSLCFSDDMLNRLVDKIETEGISLQFVASLRLLPLSQNKRGRVAKLGDKPWQEFIEMTWNRGDGCPVYFYSVKQECL